MTAEQQNALADRIAALIERATVEGKKGNWVAALAFMKEAREIADRLERRAQ